MYVLDKTLSVRVMCDYVKGSPQENQVKEMEKLVEDKMQDLCNQLIELCPLLTLRINNNSFHSPTMDDVRMIERIIAKKKKL